MSDDLIYRPAVELLQLLSTRAISAAEVARQLIERADATEPALHAFRDRRPEDLLADAQASDRRRARGEAIGALEGLPISLKDIIAVEGAPLTCGSRILENFVSPYDSTAAARLRAAGALFWGRLNLDEFAMGSSTENSAYGPCHNPWDLERVPGGSSGGSAAAVAAGSAAVALGSDTGGSIRQPAAFCGVFGMKPTYGRISRYGLAAYASSLDQIGPMGRSVADLALLLGTLAGADGRDSTALEQPAPDYLAELPRSADRPRVLGVPREYFGEGLDPACRAAVEQAIAFYEESGCAVREVSLPRTELSIPTYYIIATAEASSNLSRYDGIRYTRRAPAEDGVDLYFQSRGAYLGREVKRRIILGAYVLSSGYYDAYYLRAQKVRTLIRSDFLAALQTVDALITPVTPTPPFPIGAMADDPLTMYLADIFTTAINLAGLPAISVPAGFTGGPRPLPLAFQLTGRPLDESGLLALAERYARTHRHHLQRPPL